MAPIPHDSASAPAGSAQFPATLWSVVLQAGAAPSSQSDKALAALCAMYWYPLYASLRRHGFGPHDAEDHTQGFFAHLFAGHRLELVRREKGRFRSFLKAALHNYVSDAHNKACATKRGGGHPALSLDATDAEARYQLEPADPLDPEKVFERRWAMTILDRVVARLEVEYNASRHPERFAQLSVYLVGDPAAESYADAADRLHMSEGAVKVAVLRLRQRYRELFRELVADTVAQDSEVEDEMRHIFAILSQ
jgi:DNA-directed RNA polymerase specialized sigma24 family protein